MRVFTLTIEGLKALAASNAKRAFKSKGRLIVVDKAKGRSKYLKTLRFAAGMKAAAVDWCVTDGAVQVEYLITFERPKAHYRTGRFAQELRANAPVHHKVKPDPDNLAKPISDAMKGVLWTDDCRIVSVKASKRWGDRHRIEIRVTAIEEGGTR